MKTALLNAGVPVKSGRRRDRQLAQSRAVTRGTEACDVKSASESGGRIWGRVEARHRSPFDCSQTRPGNGLELRADRCETRSGASIRLRQSQVPLRSEGKISRCRDRDLRQRRCPCARAAIDTKLRQVRDLRFDSPGGRTRCPLAPECAASHREGLTSREAGWKSLLRA